MGNTCRIIHNICVSDSYIVGDKMKRNAAEYIKTCCNFINQKINK